MSLVYRAIWHDEPDGIHDRALDAFRWWVGKRSADGRTFEIGRTETTGGTTTLVRFGESDEGSIQRCSLYVDDGTDRWTTTLITTATPDRGSIWVDLERVSQRAFAAYRVQAPPLSTRLIAKGSRPRRGPVRLSAHPRLLLRRDLPSFTSLLGDPARDLPILLIAATPEFDAKAWHEPASHIARVLAGSAAVNVVGPVGRVDLTEILGADLGVEPGGARLYLPGVTPGEPNPSRHRHLTAARVARDRCAVADTIVQFLAPATAARRAPLEYGFLRNLLQVDVDTIAAEREELESRIFDLETQLGTAEDQVLELVADLEAAEQRVNLLQAALARVPAGGSSTGTRAKATIPVDVGGLAEAARAAQDHLTGIVLPDAACRDLDELDGRIESGAWGRTAWRGLLALNAFALDREYQPGFWLWCKANRSPFGWPASGKKLAMRESETVMANETLAKKRIMPVAEAVSDSGEIEMQAHLKIAEGGNHQIPRIYFYDDRHGPTGKVHIGFFGPHRHVPNTLT